jgi:lysophospholipase L1-like esterase
MRNITLNFPLYMGVEEVLIGLDAEAEVVPPQEYSLKGPVIFYGTSITQGGCASRPGMAYTNILSRKMNVECINLGFSGNGRGEPELAAIIAQIEKPACIVLDYEANAGAEGVMERTLGNFIQILRKVHPYVPILVVSKIRFAREYYNRELLDNMQCLKQFQWDTVEFLKNKGDNHIYFFDGSTLLGEDFDECTVDGIHPSDLGFSRMAKGLESILTKILFHVLL